MLPDRFADMAVVVAQLLSAITALNRVGIATPDDLTGLMPFIRVTRAGGPRDRINDYARLAVDVFDNDYARGSGTAEDVATFLEPGQLRYGAVLIDRVTCDNAPQELPPWAPGIFRFEATYTVVSRRHRVA
jgi:hypothetical protein